MQVSTTDVSEYYGETLQTNDDLKTNVCSCSAEPPEHIMEIMAELDDEILTKFYGCGSPIPDALEGKTILDLGCGTGTFAIMLKTRHPTARVTGLDCDPDILIQAQKKKLSAGVDITFDESMSYTTPYSEATFDTVFSSLFFHHLKSVEKLRTFREVYRVLEPGGFFHVCDWGRPSNSVSRAMSLCVQLLDGLEVTRDNIEGRLPSFIKGVGFEEVNQLGRVETILGTLHFISAKKPRN